MDHRTVGLIGGDETARLLVETGHRLGIRVAILDKDGSSSPAGQISSLCLEGNAYDQPNKIFELQGISDVISIIQKTTSIEPLKILQQQKNYPIFPSINTIEIVQNKFYQRIHFQKHDLPVPMCKSIDTMDDIVNFAHHQSHGYPIVLKSKLFTDLSNPTSSSSISNNVNGSNGISSRLSSVSMDFYLSHSTIQAGNANNASTSNTEKDKTSMKRSITLYSDDDIEPAIAKLNGIDNNNSTSNSSSMSLEHLYVEEMISFVSELAISIVKTKDNQLFAYPVVEFHRHHQSNTNATYGTLVIAPAQISSTIQQAAKDIAISAVSTFTGVGVFTVELYLLQDDTIMINEVLARPHSTGLYTLHACDRSQYEMHLRAILGLPCSSPRLLIPATATLQIVSSQNLLEAKQCFQQLTSHPDIVGTWYSNHINQQHKGSRMGHITISGQHVYELGEKLEQYLGLTQKDHHIPKSPSIVSIVIESESYLSHIESTLKVLQKFSISYEISIISPYKTPTKVFTFAQSAIDRGVKVIIVLDTSSPSGHLSSMITSLTTLPVLDASLNASASTVTVAPPTGFPVAHLGHGGMENCAFLAARIIAIRDQSLQQALEKHAIEEEESILRESDKLRSCR